MGAIDKNKRSRRYAELDVFRGLAIISVLLYHYTTRYNEIYGYTEMPFAFPYGYLGVEFFYIISGFVIYMSIENTKNSFDFILKRFSRLYPAYWVSIGITFGLVSLFTLPGRQSSFCDAMINLTMLQDWIGRVEYVDGAYWVLSRFISFYFIIFLINKFNLNDKIIQLCVIWVLLIFASKVAADTGIRIPFRIKLTFLLTDGSFFIIGIMFYLSKKYGFKLSISLVIVFCLICIYFVNGKAIFIASIIFSSFFILFCNGRLKFINVKPLTWLGGISYSLYLLHQNIGYIIIRKLDSLHVNFLVILIIPTIISLLLATAVTYSIEKPFIYMLRSQQLIDKLFRRNAKNRDR
jgi:peptidoglycan/LPS O-acetylase OafA/YrhL